jgi:hypothetical protein
MTMAIPTMIRCSVCGTESEQVLIASTNTFGPSDLDLRPAPDMRDTLYAQVQRCPSCGYCDNDITTDDVELARRIIAQPGYRDQLDSSDSPELANSFLCAAMIQEANDDFASAAWAVIGAAWACDDEGATAAARRCRSKATGLIAQAEQLGQEFIADAWSEKCILTDLLRRADKFDQARATAQHGLVANPPDDNVRQLLEYQLTLISNKDSSARTTYDALGDRPTGAR